MISDEFFLPFYDFHVVSCAGEILRTRPICKSARLKLRLGISFISFVPLSFSLHRVFCVIRRMEKVRRERKTRERRMVNNCIPQKWNVCISCEKCVCLERISEESAASWVKNKWTRKKYEAERRNDAVVEFPSYDWLVVSFSFFGVTIFCVYLNDHHQFVTCYSNVDSCLMHTT